MLRSRFVPETIFRHSIYPSETGGKNVVDDPNSFRRTCREPDVELFINLTR